MGNEESSLVDDDVSPQTLDRRDLASVAKLIKDGQIKSIVVMTGAGISTSAGIPDFRSPKTGLYANLARLDLPHPEAVFDISFFREKPEPFYLLARELYPGKYKPTVAHTFIALLAKKNLLRMLFTQNIDCLERLAGVPDSQIIEAHGSFATQRCIECKVAYPDKLMQEAVRTSNVPHCPACDGLVKPDIVFFGEPLPEKFHQNRSVPGEADLAIVMGTSLTVHPFAGLPQLVQSGIPRVLFNMELVGGLGSRSDDVCVLGECDAGVRKLADELGWREELETEWKKVSGEPATPVQDARSKDEKLSDEVDKLTSEIDESLKFSSGHVDWVQKGLDKESTKQAKAKEAQEYAATSVSAPQSKAGSSELESKAASTSDDSSSQSTQQDSQETGSDTTKESAHSEILDNEESRTRASGETEHVARA